MRWPWRRHVRENVAHDTDLAYAEERLRNVEQRAAAANHTILTRHERNHWTETLRATIHGGGG